MNDNYRVSSAFRKFSNANFENWGWETFLWNGEKIEHQYGLVNFADNVITLHSSIEKDYLKNGQFFKGEE